MPHQTDASSLPWVHFWLFGPEFGCVKRELTVVRKLYGRARCLLLVHPRHKPMLQDYFRQTPSVHIQAYRYGLQLAYRPDFDLDITKSILNMLKYILWQWWADWRMFQRAVLERPPAVIVNDFLPQVSLWARWHHIPCLGVYNYALQQTDFGPGILKRTLSGLVPVLFRMAYRLPRRMFIETLYPQVPPPAVRIPLIRRFAAAGRHPVTEKRYFLALGGHSRPEAVLDFFSEVLRHAPEVRIFIAPRYPDESPAQNSPLCRIELSNPLNTEELFEAISGVITKAGFTTVAETLQTGKALFLLPLASHPEIRETETALLKSGRAQQIRLTDPPERVAELLRHPPEPPADADLLFGGEEMVLQEILRYVASGNRARTTF